MRMFIVAIATALAGCSLTKMPETKAPEIKVPETPAEIRQGSTYAYRPLDPLNAKVTRPEKDKAPVTGCRILELLPDETMRFSVGQIDVSGKVSYGVANAGVAGNRYQVVLDYMKSTTFQHPAPSESSASQEGSAPTYVGIGMRLTAYLAVNSGNVNLNSLLALGMAGESKQVSGSIMLQTMGLSGPAISAALAIPTDISTASIQAALVSIGTIKSKIYDVGTDISPRVIGTYDVFGENTEKFDAYFAKVLSDPPELLLRVNSERCGSKS